MIQTEKDKNVNKHSIIRFSLYILLITNFLFACSSDDSIDDLLSQETTPVTFELDNGISYMFDYAGNHYVGSDTVEIYNGKYYSDGKSFPNDVEVNLRQGKHHILWFKGLSESYNQDSGISFNPETKIIEIKGDNTIPNSSLSYAECDVNVSEYLLPTQKLQFTPLTARVVIEISDNPPSVMSADRKYYAVGKITNYPLVTSVSLLGKNYTMYDGNIESEISLNQLISTFNPPSSPTELMICSYLDWVETGFTGEGTIRAYGRTGLRVQSPKNILCPANGIDNIQLGVDMVDKDGKHIATTPLPKISIKRGYTTYLYGPLFSGFTSDWIVKMQKNE